MTMTRQDAEALYRQGLEPTVVVLLDLSRRAEEAEERLRTTSSNSSKPPSSDPPESKRRDRKKRGRRKRGGQVGHPGTTRTLLAPEAVDDIVRCLPAEQCDCGGHVERDALPPQRQQKVEIAKITPTVTEYQCYCGTCQRCGRRHWGEIPKGIPAGILGPRAMAVVALLTGKYHLSKRQVEEILADLLGTAVSLGTVSNTEARVSYALTKPVEEAKTFVQQQAVVHADETGHKVGGKKAWVWVAATISVSVFLVRFSRGAEVAKELLGEQFRGWLVSDRWHAYTWMDVLRRQLCWAHLERDITKISERGGQSEEIGNAILEYVQEMWHLWHCFKSGQRSRPWLQKKMGPIRQAVEDLLAQGTACGHSKTQETCKRILKLKAALWNFVDTPGVEPTNNFAERTIRPYVLWRKISFGTQSARGNLFVERMMTVTATCRQQRRNVLEYLTAAIQAHLRGDQVPSLLLQEIPAAVSCAA
jgi:transposase